MKYNHNMQSLISDCGLAVLKSLLQFYGRYNEYQFSKAVETVSINQGMSLFNIKVIAEKFNILGECYEITNSNYIFDTPTIIVNKIAGNNHYILIYPCDEKYVYVSDPQEATILKKEHREVISENFTGYIYRVENVGDYEKNNNFKNKTREIKIKDKIELFIFVSLQWIIPMFILFSLQFLLIFNISSIDNQKLIFLLIVYSILIFLYVEIKKQLSTKILNIDYKGKLSEIKKFMRRIDSSSLSVENNVYNDIMSFWKNFYAANKSAHQVIVATDFFYFLILDIMLLFINSNVFILVSSLLIFNFLLLWKIVAKLKNLNKKNFIKLGELSVFIEEYSKNKIDRHFFSDEEEVLNYITVLNEEVKQCKIEQQKKEDFMINVWEVLQYVSLVSIFSYAIYAYNQALSVSSEKIMLSFLLVYIMFTLMKSSIVKIMELTKYQHSEIREVENTYGENEDLLDITGLSRIEIDKLTFSYDDKILLRDVSFNITEGQLLLIKGENGSGKTTLLNLITGQEKADAGSIIFYDEDNNNFNFESNVNILKKISQFSTVQYLNLKSIESNIAYSIYKENNSIPNIYFNYDETEKVIFGNGDNISLGERQKILLSRALNKEADLYIFDEPITNLDDTSKEMFLQIIKELKKQNKMVIIIDHSKLFDELADSHLYIGELSKEK